MTHNIHHHEQYQLIETRCGSCHNLEISWGARALDEPAQKQSAAAYIRPERRTEATLHHSGVDGIAFTYSGPTVWLKYVIGVGQRSPPHWNAAQACKMSIFMMTRATTAPTATYRLQLISTMSRWRYTR